MSEPTKKHVPRPLQEVLGKYKGLEINSVKFSHPQYLPHHSIVISWTCPGIGWGELQFGLNAEGGKFMDTENMGYEFVGALMTLFYAGSYPHHFLPEPQAIRWRLRGMGYGGGTSAFTGKNVTVGDDVSGFVSSKEEGEALVTMIGHGSRMDFRPSEPSWIQVKMVVDYEHKLYLEGFVNAVRDNDCMVTPELVEKYLPNPKDWIPA